MSVYIFTDGSCKKNGNIEAKASFAVYVDSVIIRGIVEAKEYTLNNNKLMTIDNIINPSNNRGELLAIIHGLLYILNNDISKTYILYSDSLISVNTINIWYKNREKNGTVSKFKNLDLIEIVMILIKQINATTKLTCVYVRAHQKINKNMSEDEKKICIGNNIVDYYANNLLDTTITYETILLTEINNFI